MLISNFNHVIESRKTFLILVISWFLIILFSYFVLPPATDDMFYFWPSLNFYYEGKIGMYDGDRFVPTFFQFPTYSILNGLFLNFYRLLDIEITSYSYRLFSKLLLLCLFVVAFFYTKSISLKNNFYSRANIFLILVTFTPFTLGTIGSVRPEPLGIILVLISIFFFNEASKNGFKNNFKILLGSFFLGIGFTVHPQFFFITSFAIMVAMIEIYSKLKNLKIVSISIFVFLFPIFILFLWYYSNYPESVDFLLNRVNYIGTNPILTFKENIKNLMIQGFFLSDSPIFVNIYVSIYTLPYIVLLIILIVIIIFSKIKKFSFGQKISVTIFVVSLLNFSFIKTYDFYNGTVGFFAVLAFCSLILNEPSEFKIKKPILYKYFKIILLIIFLTNSSFIIIHGAKFLFSKTKYFHAQNTRNKVFPYLKNDTKLILGSEKLFGVFVDVFVKKYLNINFSNVYMLFPFPDAGPTIMQKNYAQNFLDIKLKKILKSNAVLGVKNNSFINDVASNKLKLTLNGNFVINLNYSQILFVDKDHTFFLLRASYE